jgi:hypothetical protein
MAQLEQIVLWDDGSQAALDCGAVAAYLSEATGCRDVRLRGALLAESRPSARAAELAERLARLKVREVGSAPAEATPAHGEIEFERRRLARGDRGPLGVLYDGFGFQMLLRELMEAADITLRSVHIALTNRLLGTWDPDDLRYHLRAIVLGIPSIISTSGLVEAPAKPREFYLARQQLGIAAGQELAHALLKERFRGQFLDHDDPRLTEVVKGYAMQAVLYQLTGEAFCGDPDCRLFNAHWQAELIHAQLEAERDYCRRHDEVLESLRAEARR